MAELRFGISLTLVLCGAALTLEACGGGGAGGGIGDGGFDDAGRPIDLRPSEEGHSCNPGTTARGSCKDPTNECVNWSPRGVTATSSVVATCIHPCRSSNDCASSPVGHVCANVAQDHKGCVSQAVSDEGQRVDLSLLHGRMMEGCADPLQAISRLSGSLLVELEYDQASCGLRCDSASDCSRTSPFCSLGVFTNGKKGVCQVRKAGKGAKCSLRAVNEMCDTTMSTNMVCLDLGFNDADNRASADRKYGVCTEACDRMQSNCPSKADDRHSASCKFGYFSDGTLGMCSDDCSSFPDDCNGPGSPPPPGGTAHGASCIQVRRGSGTFEMPEIALCVDVEQTGTVYSPYDFSAPPSTSCDKNEISCPHGTSCIGLGDMAMTSACIYGCNQMGTPNGCPSNLPVCAPEFGMSTRAGVCKAH